MSAPVRGREGCRRRALLGAAGSAGLLVACGVIPTFHPDATRDRPLPADHALVVGRIDLIPPLREDDQKIRVGGIDPFDTQGKLRNRAVLFLAEAATTERRQTASVMNPALGDWFAIAVPRRHRFVSDATVFMEYAPQLQGRRQASVETAQLVLPAPFELDLRPSDQAIYIGSWRVWRDEFHQVTRLDVVNDLEGARAALRQRAGEGVALRAALPRVAARARG